MRKSRRLTSGEKWELGLFLSLLLVTCLCLTAILNLPTVPKLFAMAFHNNAGDTAAPTSPAAAPPALEVAAPELPTLQTQSPLANLQTLPQIPLVQPQLDPTSSPKSLHKKPAAEIKLFGGEKYRFVKNLRLRVTAYAPDSRCCWPYPGTTTASGLSVKTNHGKLVAADTRLIPMHALVSVPGYANGAAVPVLDRGGAIKGYRMDVLMPQFAQAKDWGSRILEVKIYMPIDE